MASPARVSVPAEEKVDVAVAPKAAVYAESALVEALLIWVMPESVGDVPKTSAPLPVSSPMIAANSEEVSMEAFPR